jgi:DTW domain-containing protein YfiP
MRSSTPPDLHGRCTRCYLQDAWCICAWVQPVTISFDLLVLRHWKESWRTSNTGRLAALAIENAQLLDYGAPGGVFDDTPLRSPHTFLLFPSLEDSHGLLAGAREPLSTPLEHISNTTVSTLVVVDASWGQARKLVRRIPALRELPRVTFESSPQETPRLRRPPFPGAMATMEAVSAAVGCLDNRETAATLDGLFARFVHNARAQRGGDALDSHTTPPKRTPHELTENDIGRPSRG